MGSILLSRGECRRLNQAANKAAVLRDTWKAASRLMTSADASDEVAIAMLLKYRAFAPTHLAAKGAFDRLRQSLSKKIYERSVTTLLALSEMDLSGLTHRELGALLRPRKRAARAFSALMMRRWQNDELLTLTIAAAERELARRRAEKKAAWTKKQGGE